MAADYTWPPTLPQEPMANGDVAYDDTERFLSSSLDNGGIKRRPLTSAVVSALPITLQLLGSELYTLRHFMDQVGVDAFNWMDFATLDPAEYRFSSSKVGRKFLGVDAATNEYVYEVTVQLELQP